MFFSVWWAYPGVPRVALSYFLCLLALIFLQRSELLHRKGRTRYKKGCSFSPHDCSLIPSSECRFVFLRIICLLCSDLRSLDFSDVAAWGNKGHFVGVVAPVLSPLVFVWRRRTSWEWGSICRLHFWAHILNKLPVCWGYELCLQVHHLKAK